MNEMLLKDFKDILDHAKAKGEPELSHTLQLKYDQLKNTVTNGDNDDSGVEIDDNCIKFKDDEETYTTVFSKETGKFSPSDLLPDNGPLSAYNEAIMEIDNEKMHKSTKQLANINILKCKRQVGLELTPNEVDKVLSETDVTDEILQTILKKYSGFHCTWNCNQFLPFAKRSGSSRRAAVPAVVDLMFTPYTGRVEPLLKHQKSRTRKLNRHLSDIKVFKKNLQNGKGLWPVQMDKLNREDDILQELAEQYTGLQFV